MDRNDYYGAESASLNLTQVKMNRVKSQISFIHHFYFYSFSINSDLTKRHQKTWVVIVIGILT